jgi:hypothetical protein
MPDLNQIRGTTQVKAGTMPATAMESTFYMPVASGGDVFVDKEDHSSECGGGNSLFVLQYTPVPGSEHVFLRGLLRTTGYTLSGTNITITDPEMIPEAGDELVVSYRKEVA